MSFSDSVHEEIFNNLPVYLYNLRQTNLHTHTHIKMDLMDRFQSFFLAIGWVVHAFVNYCLPVLYIGSVRLRGDYLKTMFVVVAVAKYGNNLTIPIAFGMAVENNVVSSTWSITRLKECLREGKEVVFISNMYDVVDSCIDNFFTDSYHGYTCTIVHKYLHTRVGSEKSIETLFWITLKSYTMSTFEQKFSRLCIDAREVLTNIGHPKWARAYFPDIRSNVLNMEVPQYFLVVSLNHRNVPIIALIEGICGYMKNTFVEQSIMACSLTSVLTPYAQMVVFRRMQKSVRWQATQISQQISSPMPTYVYEVIDFKTTCVVHLNGRTCSCGKWSSLGIACGHAIATARDSNMHEIVNLVQVYYHPDVFQLVYQTQTVHPLPPPSEWEIPDPFMAVLLRM
uniref:SWIM-type domain-containing protein n=1 Tax=Lactuca sativa TaxID=4236 RepID=A0A9R1UT43_LACSA|nr:hypothetical protein LSAT_V11C800395340 [Lactuca sativa]